MSNVRDRSRSRSKDRRGRGRTKSRIRDRLYLTVSKIYFLKRMKNLHEQGQGQE